MTESLRRVEIRLARLACVLGALVMTPGVARAQLPAPWMNGDTGVVGVAGSASHASGGFTVRGSGADVWGTADGFHFVYRPLTGDGQIVARVDSVTQADVWSKAGVMMRDGLEAGDAHVFALISATGAVRFQRRQTAGGTSANVYKGTGTLPYWVRLVRTGDRFAAYFSTDGATWTNAGSTTVVMNSTIYVGLAVASHNQSLLSTARFRSVSVMATTGNRPPTVTLTAPANGAQFEAPAAITLAASASDPDGTVQQVQFFNGATVVGTDTTSPYSATVSNVVEGTYTLKAVALDSAGLTASKTATVTVTPGDTTLLNTDVGTVAVPGSVTYNFNGVTIRGAGADIWGTADGFHFVYKTLVGDGEMVARLESLALTHAWAKAGVMMRETLTGGSSHAFMLVSAASGAAFQRRAVPGGTTVSTAGSTASAPRWVKLARQGSTFTASESSDGTNWTLIGSHTIAMQQTLYAGLAVTSHNPSTLTTATFTDVALRPITPGPNQQPTVAITSPASGTSFSAPATIAIAASASDPDGTVTQVQLFAGSTLLATDTTSPYTFSWTNVAAGSYSLTAVARDNLGATRTSAAVSITVTAAAPPPTRAVFGPSPDHSVVNYYLLEIFRAGDTPGSSPPVSTLNLGKPPVVNNEIAADIATLILALVPGNYIATVSAVNGAGSGRSAPSAFVH